MAHIITLGGVDHLLVRYGEKQPWHWYSPYSGRTVCTRRMRMANTEDPKDGEHVFSTEICERCWTETMRRSAREATLRMRIIWGT